MRQRRIELADRGKGVIAGHDAQARGAGVNVGYDAHGGVLFRSGMTAVRSEYFQGGVDERRVDDLFDGGVAVGEVRVVEGGQVEAEVGQIEPAVHVDRVGYDLAEG